TGADFEVHQDSLLASSCWLLASIATSGLLCSGQKPGVRSLSVPKIRLRRIRVLLHAQIFYTASAQLVHVRLTVGKAVHPALQPGVAVRLSFRLLMILAEESVVAPVASLHRRGMRSITALDHCADQKSGNDGAIRIARNHLGIHNLFRNHNHPSG